MASSAGRGRSSLRPAGRGRLLVLLVLLGVLVACYAVLPAAKGSALGQAGASVTLDRSEAGVGETVTATGSGWTPAGLVQVEVCGNDGLNGSPDCAVAEGATVSVANDGTWATKVLVWTPPKPCPCIVRARSVDADTSVSAGLAIAGATQAAPAASDEPAGTLGGSLLISDAHLVRARSAGDWFGAPHEVTLQLRVTNTGVQDASQIPVTVRSSSSGATISADSIPSIPAGGSRIVTVSVPVRFGELGSYTVRGDVGGATFSVTGSSYPWLMLLAALLLLELLGWWLVRRLRMRGHRRTRSRPGGGEPLGERSMAPGPVPGGALLEAAPMERDVREGGTGVGIERDERDLDWSAIERDLEIAVHPAIRRLLSTPGPIGRAQVQREAEAAVRPIVVEHDLGEATGRALVERLTDELTTLPVVDRVTPEARSSELL